MAVLRTGDWGRARQLLAGASAGLQQAISTSLRQEAQVLRNEIVKGITDQAPGGDPLRPLAASTIAARQLARVNGTKALIARGDLRKSIVVVVDGDEAFIGVSRSAKSRDGKNLVDIAELHEFGGRPVVIRVTPKMRRFLHVLRRKTGASPKPGTGRGVIVVQTPARPYFRPAFNRFRQGADRRFLQRVARELGWA